MLLLGFANKFFNEDRSEDLKDCIKIMIKIASCIMMLFLFLLQIPMMTVFLQGYQCNEDMSDPYGISNIECFSTTH